MTEVWDWLLSIILLLRKLIMALVQSYVGTWSQVVVGPIGLSPIGPKFVKILI